MFAAAYLYKQTFAIPGSMFLVSESSGVEDNKLFLEKHFLRIFCNFSLWISGPEFNSIIVLRIVLRGWGGGRLTFDHVFQNILAGALFGMRVGLPLVCVLTACGASSCYLLSWTFGRAAVTRYLGHRIAPIQDKVSHSGHVELHVSFRTIWECHSSEQVNDFPLPLPLSCGPAGGWTWC